MIEAARVQHPIAFRQAEQIVWQQIEEEMLRASYERADKEPLTQDEERKFGDVNTTRANR
jgi:hypothetical protein